VIRTYPAFVEFYGMEEVIDHIVSFLRHAAQGLEEARALCGCSQARSHSTLWSLGWYGHRSPDSLLS
jgi:hypothetical protein